MNLDNIDYNSEYIDFIQNNSQHCRGQVIIEKYNTSSGFNTSTLQILCQVLKISNSKKIKEVLFFINKESEKYIHFSIEFTKVDFTKLEFCDSNIIYVHDNNYAYYSNKLNKDEFNSMLLDLKDANDISEHLVNLKNLEKQKIVNYSRILTCLNALSIELGKIELREKNFVVTNFSSYDQPKMIISYK